MPSLLRIPWISQGWTPAVTLHVSGFHVGERLQIEIKISTIYSDLLVHILGSFPGKIWNNPHTQRAGRGPRKSQTPEGEVAGLISKGT